MNLDLHANFQDDRSTGLGANPGQADRQTQATYYIDDVRFLLYDTIHTYIVDMSIIWSNSVGFGFEFQINAMTSTGL